jgi:hypothetical protein
LIIAAHLFRILQSKVQLLASVFIHLTPGFFSIKMLRYTYR